MFSRHPDPPGKQTFFARSVALWKTNVFRAFRFPAGNKCFRASHFPAENKRFRAFRFPAETIVSARSVSLWKTNVFARSVSLRKTNVFRAFRFPAGNKRFPRVPFTCGKQTFAGIFAQDLVLTPDSPPAHLQERFIRLHFSFVVGGPGPGGTSSNPAAKSGGEHGPARSSAGSHPEKWW